MPFMAKCLKCNHVLHAHTKAWLKQLMALHNSESHDYALDYETDFSLTKISEKELQILEKNAHNRHFWSAFNKAKKVSRFFGMGVA